MIYEELHRIAQHYMRSESSDHTLQATALVSEAYLRLVGSEQRWQNRAHFLGVAAQMMRRILVDHARARGSAKRGSNQVHVDLDQATLISEDSDEIVLAVDEALKKLAKFDARKSQLIEVRFFGGLTHEQAAEFLGMSVPTIERELRLAKAWLKTELDLEI